MIILHIFSFMVLLAFGWITYRESKERSEFGYQDHTYNEDGDIVATLTTYPDGRMKVERFIPSEKEFNRYVEFLEDMSDVIKTR